VRRLEAAFLGALAVVAGCLLATMVWGCTLPVVPVVPVVPVEPPTPQPQPEPQPEPQPQPGNLTRADFASIQVGDSASAVASLPPPQRITRLEDGREVYTWTLSEPRLGGGYVTWEIHLKDQKVLATFPW
jgi:hypothetical protein